VRLEIAPFPLADGGTVKFSASQTDYEHLSVGDYIGHSDHYQIYAVPELGAGAYNEVYRFFTYQLFVKKQSAEPAAWIHFSVNAEPSGQFLDHVQDLQFTIGEGNRTEQGQLRLPLHSLSGEHSLSATPASGIVEVRLGSIQPVALELANRLPDMEQVIQSVSLVYDEPALWETPEIHLAPNLRIRDSGTQPLAGLNVRAKPLKVIPTTFLRTRGYDTGLTVHITYAAQAGGRPKDLALPFKVRFTPSPLHILLTLVVGAFIGALARQLSQKWRKPFKGWLAAILAAFVGAFILELLGIVLVLTHCEFKLFGLQLDPFQLPQVTLLAVLVGVFGIDISEFLQQELERRTGGKAGTPSAIAGGQS
jgi:uncharacterized membrane protein YeaQ/YmgE (transglycosylase-associated protein family)